MSNAVACVLIMIPFLFVLSIYIYNRLVKKGVLPQKYHPYTEKRDNQLRDDIARLVVLIVGAIVLLCFRVVNISLMLGIASLVQILFIYFEIRRLKNPKQKIVLEYTEGDIEEWENERKLNEDLSKPTTKLVLYDDVLYWGKKRTNKVTIHNKAGSYLFLQSIKREGKFILFVYGAMGSPMFKQSVYVPKSKEKEMNELLKVVEEKSKMKIKNQKN